MFLSRVCAPSCFFRAAPSFSSLDRDSCSPGRHITCAGQVFLLDVVIPTWFCHPRRACLRKQMPLISFMSISFWIFALSKANSAWDSAPVFLCNSRLLSTRQLDLVMSCFLNSSRPNCRLSNLVASSLFAVHLRNARVQFGDAFASCTQLLCDVGIDALVTLMSVTSNVPLFSIISMLSKGYISLLSSPPNSFNSAPPLSLAHLVQVFHSRFRDDPRHVSRPSEAEHRWWSCLGKVPVHTCTSLWSNHLAPHRAWSLSCSWQLRCRIGKFFLCALSRGLVAQVESNRHQCWSDLLSTAHR